MFSVKKLRETIDVYATRLRGLVRTCEYGSLQDDMVRDQIVDKCLSHRLRCHLLREQSLTLESALTIARSMEDADRQAEAMEDRAAEDHAACAVAASRPGRRTSTRGAPDQAEGRTRCFRCGRGNHDPDECFARTKKCHGCGRIGHFQRMCRGGDRPRSGRRQVYPVTTDHEDHVFRLSAADTEGTYPVQVSGKECDLLVDSGATCNVMSETLFRDAFAGKRLLPNRNKLYAYGSGKPMTVIGQFKTSITFGDCTVQTMFHVIPGSHQSLLGKETSERLGLLRVGPQVRCVSVTEGNHPSHRYPSLFRGGVGKLKDFQLTVPVDPDVTPVAQKVRRIPFSLQGPVERKLKELLDQDIIEQVSGPTPWVSPVVCAPKKNGDIRLCVDMRQANAAVIRERHPMPTLDDVLHDMTGSNVFSKLDLAQSFHQIELDVASRGITTFVTHKGLYRYKRLMFGISCAPEMHQRVIQQVLEGCDGVRNIADDIIVYASTPEQHNRRLEAVLRRLLDAGLKLNGEKCQFGMTELTFMGHRLSRAGVTATDEKVTAVLNAREPRTSSEVRSFLGLVTFLGRFIPDLSTVSAPLRDLTKSGVAWRWGKPESDSFNELKQRLSDKKVLAYFSQTAETQLVVDASPVGLGAVLLQRQPNGLFQPIEYASRSLTDVERRYSQTEREALAVVWGCERFHVYLYGIDFDLLTDHKALQSIFSPCSRPPARVERWVLRLQPYRYKVRHIPGPRNIADCFSRLARTSATATNSGDHYARFVALHAVPAALQKRDIQMATTKDDQLQLVVRSLPSGKKQDCPRAYRMVWQELSVCDGMLLRGDRLVVPETLRGKVLDLAHEGHQGVVRTKQKLRSSVWWPGVDVDAERLVRSCHACQVVTAGNPPEPICTAELPAGPWQDLNLDLCGPFPGGENLIVVVDKYSKWVEVETVRLTATQDITPHLEKIFARHGFPLTLTTDNAHNLTSAEFGEFCRVRGIQHLTVTPLWPQANGLVERQNRTLLKAIRTAVTEGRHWPSSLQTFLLAYRSTPHPATGVSPAELLYGRRLRTKMPAVSRPTPAPPGQSAVQQRNECYREAGKRYADRRRRAVPSDVKVGDKVLVKIPKRSTKLSGVFFREPYTVVSVNGSQVTVRRTDGRLFKRNSSFVKRYVTRDFVEPLSVPCSENPSVAPPSAAGERASDDSVGRSTELRTRSGRLVVKPLWYGDVVGH